MSEAASTVDSLRALRDNIQEVMAMPAFQQWVADIQGQIDGRKDSILNPLGGEPNAALLQEYMKGEAVGMLQAIRHWNLMFTLTEEELRSRQTEGE